MKIFVGSLPFSLEETELREFFEEYGEVASAVIIMDKFTGRSKGFGFVEMPDDAQAQKAIDELNGAQVSGRSIVVNKAEEKRDNNRGGGGFNKGGYNKGGSGGGGGYNKGGYNKGGGSNKGRSDKW